MSRFVHYAAATFALYAALALGSLSGGAAAAAGLSESTSHSLAAGSLALSLAASEASSGAGSEADSRESLRQEIFASEIRGDDRQTRQLLRAYFQRYGRDDVALMMAKASVLARLDEPEEAINWIILTLETGIEAEIMEVDPDLAELMKTRRVREAIAGDDNQDSTARQEMRAWREKHSEQRYRPDIDPKRNLLMLTSLGDESHELMRRELSRMGDWLTENLFGSYPDEEVLLVLVDPVDSPRVFTQENVAGFYEHRRRRLVSQGTGFTLRHEYVHALHYGDMERREQLHAFWILEGLATLFEYFEFDQRGSIRFLACDRGEQVQRLRGSSSLIRWRDLFRMSQMNFVAKGRNSYAQVRSIFLFLAEENKLEAWYREYVDRFEEDKTGELAFERVFNESIERVERRWREWLRAQPRRPYELRDGQPALGIEPRPEAGYDGVEVLRVLRDSPADHAGLQRGDVVIAIDGHATPGFLDLRYRLLRHRSGERLEVRFRRGEEYRSVQIQPVSAGGP